MIEPGSLVRTLFHSFSVVVHSLIQKILLGKTKSHLSMLITRKSSATFKRLLVVFDCVLVLLLVIWVVCFLDEFTTHFRNRGRTQLNRSRLLIILNIHRSAFFFASAAMIYWENFFRIQTTFLLKALSESSTLAYCASRISSKIPYSGLPNGQC